MPEISHLDHKPGSWQLLFFPETLSLGKLNRLSRHVVDDDGLAQSLER
jgi:hypothetical protein